MLCKYEYFVQDEGKKEEIEKYTKMVVYIMILLLIIRFIAELKEACCQWECRETEIEPELDAKKEED